VLGVVLVLCWIVLTFAIIGTKPLLRELIAEQQHINKLLAQLGQLLDAEHGMIPRARLAARPGSSPPR
jgi:hypothetical protein